MNREKQFRKVITAFWQDKNSWKIEKYKSLGGYSGFEKAIKLGREKSYTEIKTAGLRGRGGAGFPTHIKIFSVYKNTHKEKYLVINADESEPGACKDMPIMFNSPHLLLEGALIEAYIAGIKNIYIYLRGEVASVAKRLVLAINEAYASKYFGSSWTDAFSEKFSIDCHLHIGAGAYICGEETALLESIEGYRGQPRLKNVLPVISGLFKKPTIINNVETIASIPGIISNGSDWFKAMGTEESTGHAIYSVSGHVKHPGQYEGELGIKFSDLIEQCGGIRAGHKLKFWSPGGASTSIFTDKHWDVELSYEGVSNAGSMLGTRSIQVFDDTVCVVWAIRRWMSFYKHESCGKCTPCREGTYWMMILYDRLENGEASIDELDRLALIAEQVNRRGFCPFIDGAVLPVTSSIKYFYDEYRSHVEMNGCNYKLESSHVM